MLTKKLVISLTTLPKYLIIVFSLLQITFCSDVYALLIDRGSGLIYSTNMNNTWVQDAGLFGGSLNFSDAQAWAENLVYAGFDDWRLPSALNSDGSGPCIGYCHDSEMGRLYYGELGNVDPLTQGGDTPNLNMEPFINWHFRYYWTGDSGIFGIYNGYQGGPGASGEFFAMAVRDGDVIPEPTTMILFSSGLVGAFLRKHRAQRIA